MTRKIKPFINYYFFAHIEDMINQLKKSEPGKRILVFSGYNVDSIYSEKSTFPEWSKFFFEKSKYKNGILIEKGFWSNKKRFIELLIKSIDGKPLTINQQNAFDIALDGYFEWLERWEIESETSYFDFNESDYSEIPF